MYSILILNKIDMYDFTINLLFFYTRNIND